MRRQLVLRGVEHLAHLCQLLGLVGAATVKLVLYCRDVNGQTRLGVATQDDVLEAHLLISQVLAQDFEQEPCDVGIVLAILAVGRPLLRREVGTAFTQCVQHLCTFRGYFVSCVLQQTDTGGEAGTTGDGLNT